MKIYYLILNLFLVFISLAFSSILYFQKLDNCEIEHNINLISKILVTLNLLSLILVFILYKIKSIFFVYFFIFISSASLFVSTLLFFIGLSCSDHNKIVNGLSILVSCIFLILTILELKKYKKDDGKDEKKDEKKVEEKASEETVTK